MKRLLGVYTELEKQGGVQRLGRQMVRAQVAYCMHHGIKPVILSYLDRKDWRPNWLEDTVEFYGLAGNKKALAFKVLQQGRGDTALYLNHLHLLPLVAPLKLSRPSLPFGCHLHGFEAWEKLSGVRRLLAKSCLVYTGTSKYTLKTFGKKNRIAPGKLKVAYPALDELFVEENEPGNVTMESLTEKYSLSEKPYFFTVTRLDPQERYKGIDDILEAMQLLTDQGIDIHWYHVGRGEDHHRLLAKATSLGLEKKARFLGGLSDDEVKLLYKNCRAFVLPSTGEGLGIVYLEASSFGRPTIGARGGGAPEAVRDGKTGLLVNGGDPSDLADAMKNLYIDEQLADSLGRQGRELVKTEFSEERLQKRLYNVFNLLLERL